MGIRGASACRHAATDGMRGNQWMLQSWRRTPPAALGLALGFGLSLSAGAAEPAPPKQTPPPVAVPHEGGRQHDEASASLTLADLEQMALRRNPTLVQAAANVEIAQGRQVQSGLYPNPTVGYQADRIGAAGTAGELQGAFIDQTIITAGKLRLNRAKLGQEVAQAEAQAQAQQYRVVNGVRVRYYQLLAMQR